MIVAVAIGLWFLFGSLGFGLGIWVESPHEDFPLTMDDVWMVIFGPLMFLTAIIYALSLPFRRFESE